MISVCEPVIGEEEIAAVVSALRSGDLSGTHGTTIGEFEEQFAEFCGSKYAVAVSSGTTALQLALVAADVKPGDEVLLSASTNIATALAAHHNQAIPVPVDSEDLTWNLDLDLLESKITSCTRFIIPVHLYGMPVDMIRLCDIAERHHLVVVEDACEAHGATVYGKKAGSFGHMGCFSFYANKLVTTGEGGMVVTDDSTLAERLRLLRNLAFTQPRFVHEEAGFNFRMTGMQAALGIAQLKRLPDVIENKRRIAALYNQHLSGVPGIQTQMHPDWARSVYWMYAIALTPEFGVSRDELAAGLRNEGIDTRTFFCPMNLQPCFQDVPGIGEPCPVAERIWETGLYLPSTPTLDEATIAKIAKAVVTIHQQATAFR